LIERCPEILQKVPNRFFSAVKVREPPDAVIIVLRSVRSEACVPQLSLPGFDEGERLRGISLTRGLIEEELSTP
jgi:hypothetical protein